MNINCCETSNDKRLEYNQLLDEFILGCKNTQKIGMEYERIPVNTNSGEVVSYFGEYGMRELLREFAKEDNWDYILDDINIIGLKKLHDTITLEPGCQFELSIEPQNLVSELKNKIEEVDIALAPILNKFGIKLINRGVSPKTTYRGIIPILYFSISSFDRSLVLSESIFTICALAFLCFCCFHTPL